jgi:hypothetical protein
MPLVTNLELEMALFKEVVKISAMALKVQPVMVFPLLLLKRIAYVPPGPEKVELFNTLLPTVNVKATLAILELLKV